MNLLAFLVLMVLTAVWLVLPLVPALREFFRPTDIEPLTMVGRDNADIARFARNFREYLKGQLAQLQGEPDARGEQTAVAFARATLDGSARAVLLELVEQTAREGLHRGVAGLA